MFGPLLIVISISAIKDIFEDYKKHQSDNEENQKQVLVYNNNRFEEKSWQDLKPG
jgi:phospholipid-transporting ATPase